MTRLLVSFCNQVSSPDLCLALVDADIGQVDWLDRGFAEPIQGATGIAIHGPYVRVAFQGPDCCYLAAYDRRDFSLLDVRLLQRVKDIHSVCVHQDSLLAVSTGTNEIIRLVHAGARLVDEVPYWRHPEASDTQSDEVHVNSIGQSPDGRITVTSFGPRVNGAWPQAGGRVSYIDSDELLINGLTMPHNGGIAHGVPYACDSMDMRVVFGDGVAVALPGFTRGVCVRGDEMIVGVSGFRIRSRGTGRNRVLPPEYDTAHPCQLAFVSLTSRTLTRQIDLSDYGVEVYDVVEMDPPPCVTPAAIGPIQTRIRALETEHLAVHDALTGAREQLAHEQRRVAHLSRELCTHQVALAADEETRAAQSACAQAMHTRQVEQTAQAVGQCQALTTALQETRQAQASERLQFETQRADAQSQAAGLARQLQCANTTLDQIERSRAWWWLSLLRRIRHQLWRDPRGFIRDLRQQGVRFSLTEPTTAPGHSEPPPHEPAPRA